MIKGFIYLIIIDTLFLFMGKKNDWSPFIIDIFEVTLVLLPFAMFVYLGVTYYKYNKKKEVN